MYFEKRRGGKVWVPVRPIMSREEHARKYWICECGGSNLRERRRKTCRWCGVLPERGAVGPVDCVGAQGTEKQLNASW